jgi:hypothetical protein
VGRRRDMAKLIRTFFHLLVSNGPKIYNLRPDMKPLEICSPSPQLVAANVNCFPPLAQPLITCRLPADDISLFQVPFSVEHSLIDGDSGEVVSCFAIDGEIIA